MTGFLARGVSAGPKTDSGQDDVRFMRDALALGHRHLGQTWPNPSVGAVLVRATPRGPLIVARGSTQPGGRPHAETEALASAASAAAGATLYVSLEPCAHHGKTPPCADAIVAAGVKRVVVPLEDPDPRVAGKGHARMRAAGIAVTTDVLRDEARRTHLGHITRVTRGRPAVTLKLARTADGFAAASRGPRLIITGEAANRRVHLMRLHADAILVGIGTVLADDPRLTVRLPGLERRSPVRVVFDSALKTPAAAAIANTALKVPTWLVAAHDASPDSEAILKRAGVDVLRVEKAPNGHIDLPAALRLLADRGITRVFCEGGPVLAEALAKDDLVDEMVLVTGERSLAELGVPALGPALAALYDDRSRLRPVETFRVADNTFAVFERAG